MSGRPSPIEPCPPRRFLALLLSKSVEVEKPWHRADVGSTGLSIHETGSYDIALS